METTILGLGFWVLVLGYIGIMGNVGVSTIGSPLEEDV